MAVNSKDNQRCWNCDHFQRYDPSSTPTYSWGECRKNPIGDWRFNIDWFDLSTPFISAGDSFWCSEWQFSRLVVPPNPGPGSPPDWPDVFWEWFDWWNVRDPLNQSCYNCNHYQRVDPEDPEDLVGECRKNPLKPVISSLISGSSDFIAASKNRMYGPEYWCGCWEVKNENSS